MLRLVIILLFLIASVWLGLTVVSHPGFLFIVYQPWMVQMPVWFALLSLILAFVLFYLLIASWDRMNFVWFRLRNWLRIRREHKSYSKTQHGLEALIEGRWKKSENLLLAGVNQSLDPLINYLAAAKAAHEQQAWDRRDRYIKKAYEVDPKAELAIGITQAELELSQDQLEHAVATLNHLRQLSPRHPRVLKLLERVYVRLGDWTHLQEMLPSLRKAKLITNEQEEHFEKNIYCELFNDAKLKHLEDIQRMWNDLPRHMRKNPDVVYAYVSQLKRFHNTNKEIEELIRKTLKNHWQPQLVIMYGTLPYTNLNRQLVVAGAWLKSYGQHPELLLTLARLCVREKLWGKAKDYFEKCLALGPNPEASLDYGKLLEQLGEEAEALQKYRDGLTQIVATENAANSLKIVQV